MGSRLSAKRFAFVPAIAVLACAATALFRTWGVGQEWLTRAGPAWAASRSWPARAGRARLLAPPALAPAASPPPPRPAGPLARARHAFDMPDCAAAEPTSPRAVIVSGMWQVPTQKRTKEDYQTWLAHLSALNAPLVFFADASVADVFAEARAAQGFANQTVVIGTDVEGLKCANTDRGVDLWVEQAELDPEAPLHSPPLYAIWCSKPALLSAVAAARCFGGTHYFWYDAGAFRRGPPPGSPTAVRMAAESAALAAANAAAASAAARERGLAPPPSPALAAARRPVPAVQQPWRPALLAALPAGRVLGTMISRSLPRDALRMDPSTGAPVAPLGRAGPAARPLLRDIVAAGGFGGDAAAVHAFASAFYAMADAFLAQGYFAGKEQNVMTAACIAHGPRLCALLQGGWFDFHTRLAYAADPAAAVARLESLPDAAVVESRRLFHFT